MINERTNDRKTTERTNANSVFNIQSFYLIQTSKQWNEIPNERTEPMSNERTNDRKTTQRTNTSSVVHVPSFYLKQNAHFSCFDLWNA